MSYQVHQLALDGLHQIADRACECLDHLHLGKTLKVEAFDNLIAAGLDGIEVDHPDHSESEKSELVSLAIARNLVITGSSDYHGDGKLNRLAQFTTNPEQWAHLESKANQRRVVKR